jgi:hypothetical protein
VGNLATPVLVLFGLIIAVSGIQELDVPNFRQMLVYVLENKYLFSAVALLALLAILRWAFQQDSGQPRKSKLSLRVPNVDFFGSIGRGWIGDGPSDDHPDAKPNGTRT